MTEWNTNRTEGNETKRNDPQNTNEPQIHPVLPNMQVYILVPYSMVHARRLLDSIRVLFFTPNDETAILLFNTGISENENEGTINLRPTDTTTDSLLQ
mmetsp:Transcript_20633/g.44919  ORF Transcript_20633/g.44919 Transcript_20633/m.44919 type:complete len:98 (+) Transcript_20633:1561-1854(+)